MFNVNWNSSIYFPWGGLKIMMFTASLVLIGTDDPDSHIGSIISPL